MSTKHFKQMDGVKVGQEVLVISFVGDEYSNKFYKGDHAIVSDIMEMKTDRVHKMLYTLINPNGIWGNNFAPVAHRDDFETL